jgi:hypothetical protein
MNGKWTLLRGGKPYIIKGAGGNASKELLKAIGGNSFRTWAAKEDLGEQLDEASRLGLSVCVGIWLGQERQGFNYDDQNAVRQQFVDARNVIQAYKNHPAVLMWGLGNETEGMDFNTNPKVWRAINDIAAMAKQLDPNHPTMTVLAELGGDRVRSVHELCPDVDIVGINTFRGVDSAWKRYAELGGTKPYIITETGPTGTWEANRTSWGAIDEQTSTQKAEAYRRGWIFSVLRRPGESLGEYCFAWDSNPDAIWFATFLPDGSKLQAVDVMQELWTHRPPQNHCPTIEPIELAGSAMTRAGMLLEASVQTMDPDGDDVQIEWMLRPDRPECATPGDELTQSILSADGKHVQLVMPSAPGHYRLYAFARDGKGAAATASVPLLVEPHANDRVSPMADTR